MPGNGQQGSAEAVLALREALVVAGCKISESVDMHVDPTLGTSCEGVEGKSLGLCALVQHSRSDCTVMPPQACP